MKVVHFIKLRWLSENLNNLAGQDYLKANKLIEKQFIDPKSLDNEDLTTIDILFGKWRDRFEPRMIG